MKSKKILVVFVFLILLSILVSVKVFAVEEYLDRETRLHYKVVGDEITITGVEEGITKVDIPETIEGKTVTTIGQGAFDRRNDIVSITIPNTVEYIELCAFQGCENITEIKLPSSLKSIEGYAFADCKSLKEIEIPCNLVSGEIFNGCTKLEKVIFKEGVTTISPGAFFQNCPSLTYIYIPSSVTEIGYTSLSLTNSNITVYGDYNSYARQFCEENGINFVATSGQPQEEQKPSEEEQKPSGEEQKPNDEEQAPQGQQNQEEKPTQNNNKNNDKTVAQTKLPKARFNKYYNTTNNICINIKYNFL